MILIVGAPGAGKSVQSQLMQDEANIIWLSMGELLRHNTSKAQKERMEQGDLLNDAEVEDILADAISGVSNGTRILIDGFPRRTSQVNWFRGFIKGARRGLEAIVHIKVPLETVIERLEQRGRSDDKVEVIRKRYGMYENEILPIVDHMKERGTRVIDIDGDRDIDSVHKEIMDSLKGTI